MASASFAVVNFQGGEWSHWAQGRFDRPDYRTALNVCLNMIPTEQGALVRRPGTQFCGTTRAGIPGRLIEFDFQQTTPYLIEFTAGFMRFWQGATRVTTNDDQGVASISTANPALVTTDAPHGWTTGNTVIFSGLAATCPLLQNRTFLITVINATSFTISNETGVGGIDGSTLGVGSLAAAASVQRVLELPSPYTKTLWADVRVVQTELTAFILHPRVAPQLLTAIAPTQLETFFSFTLETANLIDGPYLDPVSNGASLETSDVSGIVSLNITFPPWDDAVNYSKGDLVYDAGNFRSLVDQNFNIDTSITTAWEVVSPDVAVGPDGFLGSDVGRQIRLFDGANWTYGKILAIENQIDEDSHIGDMDSLSAAFDGEDDQAADDCANAQSSTEPFSTFIGIQVNIAEKISNASVFPSNDFGFFYIATTIQTTKQQYRYQSGSWVAHGSAQVTSATQQVGASTLINLRAKATSPSNSADGTLLWTVASPAPVAQSMGSNDTLSAWNYVWIELSVSDVDQSVPPNVDTRPASPVEGSHGYTQTSAVTGIEIDIFVAEARFYSVGADGVTFEIIGPPLGNTNSIDIWQLGAYSDTTTWPSCGTYHEGRLWLAGAIPNRVDASQSNSPLNFAPTKETGQVIDSDAISAVFNAPDVNAIFWMVPDALGIICGTLAGDWLIQASANNNVLTPSSIQAHRFSKMGCANIEPRRADHALILVQQYRRKLFEYFADVFSGKFNAQNVTWAVKHLTKAGIAEIAYQHELAPIVWSRIDDGSLFGLTYRRESNVSSQPPNFAGAFRVILGDGSFIESIWAGPSPDGIVDSLAMITNDTSINIRHVSIMTPLFEEGDVAGDAWFLDDAVRPSSTSTSSLTPAPYGGLTLNGLWHLNNQTVSVYANGMDCGDFVVDAGSVIVPYGDGISAGTAGGQFTAAFAAEAVAAQTIVVGFTYDSDFQIVRPMTPQETGARNGPALAKRRRVMQFGALLDQTVQISFGTDFTNLYPALFKATPTAGAALPVGTPFSGVYTDTIRDEWAYDSMICGRISRPYSATIVALEGFIETSDK